MIQRSQINAYVQKLAQEFDPERVILFGSYAHGKPTVDSDVDLLVIMNHGKKKNVDQAIDIDRRINYSFPLDLLVRTPTEIKRRIALRDVFVLSILKQGRIVYERRRQRMAGEGRRRLRNGSPRVPCAKSA
jgi:predicted nucleotidyltransferase